MFNGDGGGDCGDGSSRSSGSSNSYEKAKLYRPRSTPRAQPFKVNPRRVS